MRLIYLSPVPWASFAQRPHKFVEWFHSRTRGLVLWVDPYPTRFPKLQDLRRASAVQASTHLNKSTPAWLTVIKPGALPIEPMPGSHWVNNLFWKDQLQVMTDFARQSKTWIVIGKPSALGHEVLKRLNHCPSLYDAMDEFPAFYSGLSSFTLAQREHRIVRLVDVVSASSTKLKSQWDQHHGDVRLAHNAFDPEAFRLIKKEHASAKNKVFGYVGTIASWFDWDWIYSLSKVRPNDEIRLIGPVFARPAARLPDNVKLLSAFEHETALQQMAKFHVGLIPFKINALTASVDPIKYYEYRALGLPVVSTSFGEMSLRTNANGVFIAQPEIDIRVTLDSALHFEANLALDVQFKAENTWETRFDTASLIP